MAGSTNRRDFIKAGAVAAGLPVLTGGAAARARGSFQSRIEQIGAAPVLNRSLLTEPVKIASVELLKAGDQFLVRVRSQSGATGIAAAHPDVLETTWPILVHRVAPFFAGKDARDLEALVDGVYLANSNYKWQGLPFWVPVASVEFATLDLLGKVAGKPIGDLFGGVRSRDIAVYRASGNRGNSPEQEIAFLQKLVAETGAKAIKFRLGARMREDVESMRRDHALIPLTRKTFGDGMTIYADANGSYDVPTAVRIGRLMQEHRLAFLEEPVPFDYYDETKDVADQLPLPVAGGEQESSLRRFRWMIEHKGVDVVQPDLFYFGGFVQIDPRRAHGGSRRHSVHAAHVGRRPRLSVRRALCVVRAERRPLSGIQGPRRLPAGVLRHVAADLRQRHAESAHRPWTGRDDRSGIRRQGPDAALTQPAEHWRRRASTCHVLRAVCSRAHVRRQTCCVLSCHVLHATC